MTFSLTENHFSGKTYFYTIAPSVLHCNEGFQPMGVSVTKCLQDPTTKAHKWSDPESLGGNSVA